MEIILNFFVDNYLWFLIISLILIFGLIGYIVDVHEKRTPKLHFGDSTDINSEEAEETKTLKELLEENDVEEKTSEIKEELDESDDTVDTDLNNNLEFEENEQNELPKL